LNRVNEQLIFTLAGTGNGDHLARQGLGKGPAPFYILARQRNIELKITRNPNTHHTGLLKTLRILQGLRINDLQTLIRFTHNASQPDRLTQRVIGKARTGQQKRYLHASSLSDDIRPYFAFDENADTGLVMRQETTDTAGKIIGQPSLLHTPVFKRMGKHSCPFRTPRNRHVG